MAKTSAQFSLNRATKFLSQGIASSRREGHGSRKARTQNCARAHSLAETPTANPEKTPQQETPYAFQKAEIPFWLRFGEASSALRGWRPIPAALPSHSVLLCSGTEDISLPTQRLQTTWSRPTQGKTFPDKQGSIRRKPDTVKSFAPLANNFLWKSGTWHDSCSGRRNTQNPLKY